MTQNDPGCDWLKKWALYAPDKLAIKCCDSGRSYTYSQLFKASQSLAWDLSAQYELAPGERVAVLAANEIEYVILFFALQRLAVIMVPINFRLTAPEISHVVTDSGARLLIYQKQYESVVKELPVEHLLPFDGENSLVTKISESREQSFAFKAGFADPCLILYTSGTTGAPKGAVLTYEGLFWNSINTALRLNITTEDRTVIFLPFFHTGGWNVLTTPFLHHGAEVHFLKKFDPEGVLKLCDQEKMTVLFGVPTTMEMMARTQTFRQVDLSSLRYAIVGGEPMTESAIHQWGEKGVPVRQGYGLTECGPNLFSLNEEDAIRKIGSIGYPNFYVEARIVNEGGQDVKYGQVGELLVRGPMRMSHYWQNRCATHETIKDGWVCTGDLVRQDDEGYYYVVGRKKEMYISGGENVYPAEVEKVIYGIAGVREVAVIGVADEQWGETGKAFVVLESTAALTAEDIRQHCLKNLAKFKIPKQVVFLQELPKGDSGKILKRQLLNRKEPS